MLGGAVHKCLTAVLLATVFLGCSRSVSNPPGPSGASNATSSSPSTQGGKQTLPTLQAEPEDGKGWDAWLDTRVQVITEWLTKPETLGWTEAQLESALGVSVHGGPHGPDRIVQLGPLTDPSGGTVRPTYLWIQWRGTDGGVQAQQLDTPDVGTYRSHRISDSGNEAILILLTDSVMARPNQSFVWVWRLDRQGKWTLVKEAFQSVTKRVIPGITLVAGREGLGVIHDASDQSPARLVIEGSQNLPEIVICEQPKADTPGACGRLVWANGRFRMAPATKSDPLACAAWVLYPGLDLGRERDEVLGKLGEPDEKRPVSDIVEIWHYPDLGLSIVFLVGKVDRVSATKGALSSGLQIGDSISRAIQVHGKPKSQVGGLLRWEYSQCALVLEAKVSDDRITEIEMINTL